jgi:Lon protease-like protein
MMNPIPLFPLHTVLFPGMPIRLQVFEDRYLDMVQTCIDQDLPFGVVLIKEGMEALGPLPIPHKVGCLTTIQRMHALEDGRLNLIGQGIERIEILEVLQGGAYLQGMIKKLPLRGEHDPIAIKLAQRVQPLLAQYLVELAAIRERSIDPPALPSHPERLAYLTASLLQIPSDEKQLLLSEENASRLLHKLQQTLSVEIPLLRMTRKLSQPEMIGSFGLN